MEIFIDSKCLVMPGEKITFVCQKYCVDLSCKLSINGSNIFAKIVNTQSMDSGLLV